MRLREVFRYEFGYRLRSGATWAHAAFLFLVMAWGLLATADGSDAVAVNAPRELALAVVRFGGLFGLIVSAALFGDAAIRDPASGMDPLLYTTRLRPAEYLGGRFLAALAVNAIVVVAVPLGFLVSTLTLVDADAVGPHRVAAYAQPLLLFLLPNLVLVGAIQFAIGTLVRQAVPVYLGTAAFFVGYIVAANYWSALESPTLSALADPLGINALEAMTRYWTPAELNARLVGFPAVLLANRVLWLAVALAILAALVRGFRFAHRAEGASRRGRRLTAEEGTAPAAPTAVPAHAGTFGARTRVRQTLAVARRSLAEVASGRAFQAAMVAAVGLVLLWGWNAADTAFDTATWPVTHLVLSTVLSQRAILVPWAFIALYAGELVWKDREVGASEIADAAPVPTGVALLGRFLALVAIVVAVHVAFLAGGVLLQTLQGYRRYEPGLYLRVLFGLNLLSHVILAALAMAVHVLVNQKYVGHVVVMSAFLLGMLAAPLGLSPLAVYGAGPRWTYSDMNGFGPFLAPFLWFKAYWAAWALLLGVVARLFWVRGREPGARRRLAVARARLAGRTARVAGAAPALALALGGFVSYNTAVLAREPAPDEASRPLAEYERRYARFADAPQPSLTAATLRVELYPDAPAADLRGAYTLVNRTAAPIDSVHVVLSTDVAARTLTLDRPSREVLSDAETGYRILALARPLAPGDSLRLAFDVTYRPRGFRAGRPPTAVVGNGTYVDRTWLPFVGYQPAFEVSGATARRRLGLVARTGLPAAGAPGATDRGGAARHEDRVLADVTVGTSADQLPVATGLLRRSWTENGRNYARYGTAAPSPFGPAAFSARYAVRDDRWRGVALRVLHHPAHGENVGRMLAAMKASLDHYARAFGPYQYDQLRVVEIPPYSINGRAMAGAIAFAEQNFITRGGGGRVDHASFGTAHEVAHAWWGGQVRPAHARGAAFVSEGLSNYSAMMVTERTLGAEEARRVYDYQMDRYLTRRAEFARDVPLVEVEDHPHVAYGKGAVALYTMREHLGEAAMDAALRRLLERYRGGGAPYATAGEVVAELRAVTPDSLRHLVTDLFETITLWDVATRGATVTRTADGRREVALDVVARKLRADSVGRETETPMDDLVEVGVYAAAAADGARGAPLYLRRHRLRSGRQTIRVVVSGEPARAGVDPARKLIERDRSDNVATVRAAPAAAP
ncbi:M1 family aminopeptidase [Roseisolibacter sp. H3M3-2]|uniref:M1 family aminopeptidase n=1 Tax=Roseisolibacter sp. H3M3-2 TaxID=3031323 RepID=UPI0023DA7710|nr:M1 family aminopeptidase [Roseisolibacter sp. H3M3-2]MDF1501413.1 M1 family aminopeptidase [Roseisolibacter sp. H3M3-2]